MFSQLETRHRLLTISPRSDRLGRVERAERGRVRGTPSALAFSIERQVIVNAMPVDMSIV